MGINLHSHINVTWVTGYQRKYYLHSHPTQATEMIDNIKFINTRVEGNLFNSSYFYTRIPIINYLYSLFSYFVHLLNNANFLYIDYLI